MREEGEAQMCLEHPVLKVSIYSKTFFSEIDSLHIALTLVQGPGQLSPLAPCLAPFFKIIFRSAGNPTALLKAGWLDFRLVGLDFRQVGFNFQQVGLNLR